MFQLLNRFWTSFKHLSEAACFLLIVVLFLIINYLKKLSAKYFSPLTKAAIKPFPAPVLAADRGGNLPEIELRLGEIFCDAYSFSQFRL